MAIATRDSKIDVKGGLVKRGVLVTSGIMVTLGIMIFLAGFAFGSLRGNGAQDHWTESAPVILAVRALSAEEAGDTNRASALMGAALSALREKPDAARDVWDRIRTYIERDFTDRSNEALVIVDRFKRHLDRALNEVRNENEFSTFWEVRSSAVRFESELRQRRHHQALNKLVEIRDTVNNAGEYSEAISEFITETNRSLYDGGSSVLAVLFDAIRFDDDVDDLHSQCKMLVESLLELIKQKIDEVQREIQEQVNRDQRRGDLEPVEGEKGPYQRLFDRTVEIHNAVDEADIISWVLLLDDKDLREKYIKVEENIEEIIPQVASLQRLRYNLWAMTQIYAAEEVPGWPERLGLIEINFLHPTVSTLYSEAFNTRLNHLGAGIDRHVAVRRLLAQRKPTLSQF